MRRRPALNAHILYLFVDSANMHRWNDHLRPVDLTEMDKQAHKAAISWLLGKYEEKNGRKVDWRRLIEHQMFSFIQRSVMTDLKPQVFHKIVQDRKAEVNAFVISEFDRLVPDSDPGFRDRLVSYLDSDSRSLEDEIVVTVIATGFDENTKTAAAVQAKPAFAAAPAAAPTAPAPEEAVPAEEAESEPEQEPAPEPAPTAAPASEVPEDDDPFKDIWKIFNPN